MVDWVIVGGGIHGVLLAVTLLNRNLTTHAQLRIVDPHEDLLSAWTHHTEACGMAYLRSPGAHGLEPDFSSVPRWAKESGWNWPENTISPYDRPSLPMFCAYAADIVRRYRLPQLHMQGSVTSVRTSDNGWVVDWVGGVRDGAASVDPTRSNALGSHRVVLALGPGSELNIPAWARRLDRCCHLYDMGFARSSLVYAGDLVIVGGGVAAVQLASWCAERAERPVRLISRAPIRVAQFDSDPCFVGPRCMKSFLAERDFDRRRNLLKQARNRGSVPPDALSDMQEHMAAGRIVHTIDQIEDAATGPHPSLIRLKTRNSGVISASRVLLATGYSPARPGDRLLSQIERDIRQRLPARATDERGFPVLRSDLAWTDGLYVMGRLAELELGPSAPNIIGAHNAAKRMVSALAGRARPVPTSWRSY